LAPYRSYPFNDEAAERYSALRDGLEKAGNQIGPNDLLIASICLTFNCTLVTGNQNEFSRVPELQIENWLKV
jgi:tRNA(fMet)-specific endonuclease VapC